MRADGDILGEHTVGGDALELNVLEVGGDLSDGKFIGRGRRVGTDLEDVIQ